ncbi:MAG TPA: hypothetical protein VGG61_02490 [Gemmataceae bacterium]|jgi:hypothetical protein
MYVRYATKETQARIECDLLAHHDDGRVMVLSCHGPQQSLRGLSAVLTSDTKMRLEWYDDDDCATEIGKDGCGYRTFKHPLCQGLWQFLWVSKDTRLLVAGKDALGQALLGDPFTTPVLPDWVPHLQAALEEDGLLTALSGEGCESAYLTASCEELDQIVSDGIRSGKLKIG